MKLESSDDTKERPRFNSPAVSFDEHVAHLAQHRPRLTNNGDVLEFSDPFKDANLKTGRGDQPGNKAPEKPAEKAADKAPERADRPAGKPSDSPQNEAPRLRTELPGPIPATPLAREEKGDGPRVVTALMMVPPPPENPLGHLGKLKDEERPKGIADRTDKRTKEVAEFSNWLNKNFDRFDDNKDRTITKPELEKKMLDPTFAKGDDAVKMVALHNMFSGMQETFGKQDDKGLTKSAVEKFEDLAKDKDFLKSNERALSVSGLADTFGHFDTNKDHTLSPAEVDAALTKTDLAEEQRQALKDLRVHQTHVLKENAKTAVKENGRLLVQENHGAFFIQRDLESSADLKQYEVAQTASGEARLINGIATALERSEGNLQSAKSEPNLISQGTDGSCFALAPLISLSKADPAFMDKMIKDNNDGTRTVTFPGAPDKPITILKPTDAEMANWSRGEKTATMEKALGEYLTKYPFKKEKKADADEEFNDTPKVEPSLIPAGRITSGLATDAFELFTGKKASSFEMQREKKTDDELRAFLKGASEKSTPMVANTDGAVSGTTGFIGPHSYSIKYDAKTDNITFENPVKPTRADINNPEYPYEPHFTDGRARDGKNDGVFTMKLEEAKPYLTRLIYSDK